MTQIREQQGQSRQLPGGTTSTRHETSPSTAVDLSTCDASGQDYGFGLIPLDNTTAEPPTWNSPSHPESWLPDNFHSQTGPLFDFPELVIIDKFVCSFT